uniref:Uncharacterized protein n=1 Tax=Timema genevievae TaxID=629358 RepID=A0A7R9JUK4_TIMGE|nr:unnamed protein product [Timema genevievae]
MDSCFPPFAALSLRDNSNRKSGAGRNGSRPISAQVPPGGAEIPPEKTGKIEILQDLDLYYIRQIAHNLKTFHSRWPTTRSNPLTSSLATWGPQVFGVDTVHEQVVDKHQGLIGGVTCGTILLAVSLRKLDVV